MLLADWLQELGYEVVGPVGSAADALPLIETAGLGAILLDITLRDGHSFPLADAACERGLRIAFITGRDASEVPGRLRSAPILSKPFEFEALKELMASLIAPSQSTLDHRQV